MTVSSLLLSFSILSVGWDVLFFCLLTLISESFSICITLIDDWYYVTAHDRWSCLRFYCWVLVEVLTSNIDLRLSIEIFYSCFSFWDSFVIKPNFSLFIYLNFSRQPSLSFAMFYSWQVFPLDTYAFFPVTLH